MLAPLLRRLRQAAGLTQEELAERAGVSVRTISDAERGLRARLYADTAGRLADALGLEAAGRDEFLAACRTRSEERKDLRTLPHPLTPLLGRNDEVAFLQAELAPDSARRLVTVTGLGGSGKTRLAIAVAERLLDVYAGRVSFVLFAAADHEQQLMEEVAVALGTVPARIDAVLAGHPTLMVLDAFEHVLPATDALAELLMRCPQLHVLVTSRVRLRLTGERELVLGSLPPHEAARLFLDRAHDVMPGLPSDDVTIAEICALTSGLPLPLELAAAHVRYLPLPLLRDRLRDGLTDATRVVQDAVSWTLSSLDDDERRVLAWVAMFPGGCHHEALQAVSPGTDVVTAIGQLSDKCLVMLDSPGPAVRWSLLDAVREAVLRAEPADAERRATYTRYYLQLLRDVQPQVGHEKDWYQALAAEEANVRTALGWAEREGDADTLLELATGLWLLWQSTGRLEEGRRWLSTGLAMAAPARADLRQTALWGLAWLAYHQGDDEAAERAGQQLAEVAGADPLTLRNALTIAGIVAIARDRPAEAIALMTRALETARELPAPWIRATSLLNVGMAHLAADAPHSARPVLAEALQQYDELGDVRFHARCVGYLGLAALLDGDPARAKALFAQSLVAFQNLREPAGIAEGLAGLAAVEAVAGDVASAALLAGAAERLRDSVAARELPLERRVAARYLGAAARAVGPDAWAESWRRGRELSADEVLSIWRDEVARA